MNNLKTIRPVTIRKVINYIESELGLSIYGSNMNLDTAQGDWGCRDFNADDVIKLRALYLKNITIKHPDEQE